MGKVLEIDVGPRMTKNKLLRTMFLHLIEDGMLDDEVLQAYPDETENAASIRRQELELQFRQTELEKFNCEENTKLREAELEVARLRGEAELEAARLREEEEETKQLLIKQQMAEAQIWLEEKKLEAAASAGSKGSSGIGIYFSRGFELPKFNEKDPELFFLHSAKLATSLKWPEVSWLAIMQGKLKGKAQDIFASLPFEDSFHYPTVKKRILQAYEVNAEALRQTLDV